MEADAMSEQNPFPQASPNDEGGLRAPPGLSAWRKAWWWFDFLILVKLARLRFVGVLVAIGLLIVYWDTLVAYYEKWTRPTAAATAGDPDTEYFCPMHPQVVTHDPKEKCPICFMNLAKRKKSEAKEEALPPGVVNRLQLSPYRVVAAGIRTWGVKHEPLRKVIETVGTVEFDERKLRRISVKLTGRSRIDQLFVNVTGQTVNKGEDVAKLYNPDLVVTVQNLLDAHRGGNKDVERVAQDRLRLWGIEDDQVQEIVKAGKPITQLTVRSPISGHVIKRYTNEGEYVEEGGRLLDVADLSTVWVEAQVYEDNVPYLTEGLVATAWTEGRPDVSLAGKLAFVHPHLDATSRTLRVRFDIDNAAHELRPGMYATVRIDIPASRLSRSFKQKEGHILAVPEDAVIHTGNQHLVYRQESETVFDAVKVEVGPLMTKADGAFFYPVLGGLEPGDRVVTTGSYLLDAETRVSAAAGSIYYGGSGSGKSEHGPELQVRPTTPEDRVSTVKNNLAKLSTPDRKLAEAQRLCPVLRKRLGSMGVPVKVLLKGQAVFLCCRACEADARDNPDKTLVATEKLKQGSEPTAQAEASEAKIRRNLAKLSAEDRKLAEAQKYCPSERDSRLGSMGVPIKTMIEGRPVFFCCQGCVEGGRTDPGNTLAEVEKLKARAKAEADDAGKGGQP
jgi:multidrug efflux pump subunit AcrA (membrane-fusion protein)